MARSDDKLERAKPEVTGLESYRRLIELQKQMVVLSQRYEQTKRERDQLREAVARDVADQLRARKSVWHRWHRFVRRQLKRGPATPRLNLIRLGTPIRTNPSVSH